MTSAKSMSAGLLCLLTLGGCATYAPQPVTPAALSAVAPLPGDVQTYDDLLRLALARSPAVRAEATALKAARASARSARQLPPVNLSLGAEYSKAADANRPWQFSAAADIPVDAGGRRATRLNSADLAVQAQTLKLGDAIWGVRSALRTALIDRQGAVEAKALNGALAADADRRLTAVTARVRLGEDAGDAADLARLEGLRARQGERDAQTALDQANAALAALLHIAPADAAAIRVEITNVPPSPQVLAARASQAPFARGDVLAAVTAYDQAESDLRLEVARQYPEVRVGPGYTWERGIVKLPFTLALVLPTFDRNAGNIAAAEQRRVSAGAQLEAAARQAVSEGVQARNGYDAAMARQAAATTDLKTTAARQAARAEASLKAGEIDRTEQLQAAMTGTSAAIEAGAAKTDSARALLKLEDAWRQSADDGENARLAQFLTTMEGGS